MKRLFFYDSTHAGAAWVNHVTDYLYRALLLLDRLYFPEEYEGNDHDIYGPMQSRSRKPHSVRRKW